MNYKNMSNAAPYRLTEINHATYMATTQVASSWLVVPGWTLHTCVYDIMHNLYLGTGRDLVASCLRLMLEKGCFDHYGVAPSSEIMFVNINKEINAVFKQHRFLGKICFVCFTVRVF